MRSGHDPIARRNLATTASFVVAGAARRERPRSRRSGRSHRGRTARPRCSVHEACRACIWSTLIPRISAARPSEISSPSRSRRRRRSRRSDMKSARDSRSGSSFSASFLPIAAWYSPGPAASWHRGARALPRQRVGFALRLRDGVRDSEALMSTLRDYRATFAAGGPIGPAGRSSERFRPRSCERSARGRCRPTTWRAAARRVRTYVRIRVRRHGNWSCQRTLGGREDGSALTCAFYSVTTRPRSADDSCAILDGVAQFVLCGGRTSVHDITRRAVTNETGVVDSDCSTVLLAQVSHAPRRLR